MMTKTCQVLTITPLIIILSTVILTLIMQETECQDSCFKKSWYTFSKWGGKWKENKDSCQYQGGYLVSIETEEEWQFIRQEIRNRNTWKTGAWHIGLKKIHVTWTWQSGSQLNNQMHKWRNSEPNANDKYAEITKNESLFNGVSENDQKAFICEMPEECPNILFDNSWYIFSYVGERWDKNRDICQSQGGDLVSIETEEEWKFINDNIQRRSALYYHIGLVKRAGNWTWVSGGPLTICKWSKGNPSGGDMAGILKQFPRNGPTQGVFSVVTPYIVNTAYICEMPKASGKNSSQGFCRDHLGIPCTLDYGKKGWVQNCNFTDYTCRLNCTVKSCDHVPSHNPNEFCGHCSQTYRPWGDRCNDVKYDRSTRYQICNATRCNMTSGGERLGTEQACYCTGDQCNLKCNGIRCKQTCTERKTATSSASASTLLPSPSSSPFSPFPSSSSSSVSSSSSLFSSLLSPLPSPSSLSSPTSLPWPLSSSLPSSPPLQTSRSNPTSTTVSYESIQRKQDLVAIISGGAEVIRGLQKNITLNASLSYDPEVEQGDQLGMNFTWNYGEISGHHHSVQLRKAETDFFTALNESAIRYYGKESGEQISLNAKGLFPNQTYVVRLIVTKDYRNSTVYQVIHFSTGDSPELYQRCFINCRPEISPLVKLSVQSLCQGQQCSKISFYEWILYQKYWQNASNVWRRKHKFFSDTPLNSSNIVIKGGSLAGGKKYRLALFITTTDGLRGMSAYDIYTALPPAGGNCSITPPSGISLENDSILSCSNWKSDNTPLSYQFQYSLGNGLYSVLYDGLNSSIVTSWIPLGNTADNYTVKINVTVTDKFGVSASPVHLTVQIKPSQRVKPATANLMANNSLFSVFIKKRNLEKAALIANSGLRSMSRTTSMDSMVRSKVINYIIGKMGSLEVKNIVEILQSSSVIGSALKLLETVSPESLNISLSAVGSMTSLLWSIAQSKDVEDIPLITKSAQNLASCLDSVLKAAALLASKDFKSSFQEQGKILVNISIKVLEKVADSVLALAVPDVNTISITAGQLSMTLGRYSIDRLSRLVIRGGRGRFILPTESQLLVSGVHKTSIVDVQMLALPINPYTWDDTKERVGSDVLFLHLKNNKGELIKISNISEDITIVTPLKLQEIPTEWSKYFTKKDDLRFHEIKVKYENTLLMLEIRPRDTTVHMFVYMRFGQRPTTRDYDLNATISPGEKCVWMPSVHEGQTICSLNPIAPIQILAKQPGKYFVGLKNYNATVNLSHKREKRSCFEERQRKRSCIEVKDAPPIPPRGQIVSVVPAYDSTSDQNYSLKVSSGSCVHWSVELEKWISSGCRVLAASDGFLNCSCNHLTAFGGSLIIKPNPIDFDKVIVQFQNISETGNVAVIVAIAVVFLCYMVVLVIVRKIDKEDAKNDGLLIHLPSSSNGTFEYEIVITTGVWKNSGTTARVAMEIYGSGGKSGILQLSQEEPGVVNMLFSRSNSDVFILSLNKSLGSIQAVQIGHNNFGNNPSWFLEEILIRDVRSNQSWKFMVSQWFALERGDGRIERIIDLTSTRLDFVSDVARRWRRGLAEWHIWVSVAAKLKRSRFTRVQRLSCCLSVLLTSMFANAMFYKLGGKYEQPIQVGPLKMSWRQVVTGIESALVVAPINIIIVLLFQKGAEKSSTKNSYCMKGILITGSAWFFLLCSCIASPAFSIFYSLIWDKTVSEQWLSSMLISFAQDLIIKEPVKVFFTALLLAAILKMKNKRSKEHACKNSQQVKRRCSKQRFWTLKVSEVEKMSKCQAKKQNLSRYFTELAIYFVFVFLLMIVCYGNRNDHRYLMTKSIWDGLPNFQKVANNKMYWSWLQNIFLPGVFSGRWYNGQEENETMYIGNKHSLLVGMPRVRQFRVKSTQCKVLKFMDKLFRECFEGYSTKNEDKTVYNKPGWRPADNDARNDELLLLCPKPWRYQHAEETEIVPKWGQFSFYHGGGFVADLGYENHTGFCIITSLQNNGWLDRHTAVVIAEFSSFNPSVNILGVATYFYEIDSSGLKAASTQTSVLFLQSTDTTWHQFYLISLSLFIVMVFLYSGREIFRLYNCRSRYFKSKWNWVEMFQLVFSLLAVVMHMIRQIKVTSTVRKLRENIYAYILFQEAITWQQGENGVLGILMFIVTIKLLRVIRFNKHVVVYSKTLKICWRSLSSFSVVLLTLFMAFLHFGVLMFGSVSERYSSLLKGTYFQLELTLGRVKARPINELAEANTIYAKIFAFLILFTLSILCMNFFVGMVNDALLEAKRNVNESELYELIDEDICSSLKERRGFFDAISKTLKQWTAFQTCEKEEKSESGNVGIHFKKSSKLNFDLISQATESWREEITREKIEEHRCSIRRQSFFDKISSMLKSAKCEKNNECSKGKEKKKVRFQEDVIESSFRNLRSRKHDLMQRLKRIVSGFSEEDKEFYDLLQTAKAQNYWTEGEF